MKTSTVHVMLALLMLLTPLPALAKRAATMTGLSCVHVKDHVVTPLIYRVEGGTLRCAAAVVVDKKAAQTDVQMSLRVLQKPENAGDKEERAKVEQKVSLWPGFKGQVEIESAVPAMNGCMPYQLVVVLDGQSRTVKGRPTCPD